MENKSIEYKYCCGCGLCSHFVNGNINEQGYYRPSEKSFLTNFDTSICYCNQVGVKTKNGMWGLLEGIYYGYAIDSQIRKKASSGGILTAIACYLLDERIVDQVVQIATSKHDQMKTEVVWNSTSQDVKQCCGSRYTASASLEGLLDNIDTRRKYAVIGKPCDIRVLRAYLEKSKELNSTILYLLTFFCGGTPSTQANDKLLKRMGLKRNTLQSFIYRGNGWPGKTSGVDIEGNIATVEYEESWGKVLGRDIQDICRFCWEGVGEAADISCGDGWYLEDNQPSFEEREGRNVIFARTNKGNKLLMDMQSAHIVQLENITDTKIIEKIQPGQLMRKGSMFSRILAMKLMGKKIPRYSIIKLLPYARSLSFKLNIRMFAGTVKRILKGKIQ
ncbi:Coenzyme F420 hydrogenase/dehydrogenase, beta subunit C-terminal domain [Anaeromicropila herbilytica]|uniref:F420H2-dehydrogenase n=1 Tax=Anaeromicropila herbilytica TaxID=2785025 RepID=A0A7R7ENX8_9FIRM|nr:Coenzyme F420 hydrogenase/dehydrogenase, beta subunit C-terminal domain [Anaeromicropila herbilytica]BCN32278.1 F420H2-dehydrogenase [Anaeromicropila herbilytica]